MKERKASDIVQIDGLPESKAIWSKTVLHPQGVKYTTGVSKGKVKKVTQYAMDEAHTNVIDDGMTADRDRIETLKYDGSMLRWLKSDLNPSQLIFIQELRGYELECKVDDLVDRVEKMINVSMNAQNVSIDLDDLDHLMNDSLSRLQTAFKFTANKVAGGPKAPGEKPIKPRKFGI